MVASIGHWAVICGLIDSDKRHVTDFGRLLLDDEVGLDPYLEDPATLWLLHWKLTRQLDRASTWHFAFNHFAAATFEKETLAKAVTDFARDFGTPRITFNTLKRDVDCFLNTYVMRRGRKGEISEESLDCPFTELKLIQETPTKGLYAFDIGEKATLPDEIFCYALMEFVATHHQESAVIGFERIAFDPGSPGRCFKLSEDALIGRLERCAEVTDGALAWIDTSGVRQLQARGVEGSCREALLTQLHDRQCAVEAAA